MQVEINTAIDRNGHVLTRIVENTYFNVFSKENIKICCHFSKTESIKM